MSSKVFLSSAKCTTFCKRSSRITSTLLVLLWNQHYSWIMHHIGHSTHYSPNGNHWNPSRRYEQLLKEIWRLHNFFLIARHAFLAIQEWWVWGRAEIQSCAEIMLLLFPYKSDTVCVVLQPSPAFLDLLKSGSTDSAVILFKCCTYWNRKGVPKLHWCTKNCQLWLFRGILHEKLWWIVICPFPVHLALYAVGQCLSESN